MAGDAAATIEEQVRRAGRRGSPQTSGRNRCEKSLLGSLTMCQLGPECRTALSLDPLLAVVCLSKGQKVQVAYHACQCCGSVIDFGNGHTPSLCAALCTLRCDKFFAVGSVDQPGRSLMLLLKPSVPGQRSPHR